MQTGNVTTPFGRRSVPLALVRKQQATVEIRDGKCADKWKVFRDVSAAMDLLGIRSNSLAVLDALISFYPENEFRQDAQLVVFPSNLQLSLRAHGMPGSTLRRHLAVLVDAGLIFRRDSANGKRFARKDNSGAVESAFGFDLAPLLMRAEELAILAQKVMAERAALRKLKENLTICRRDVRKLITAAVEERIEGEWQTVNSVYEKLVGRIPRVPTVAEMAKILEEMEMLKDEVLNRLNLNEKPENISVNAAQIEQHIQNSNTESLTEFEPRSEKEQGAGHSDKNSTKKAELKAFPLGLILRACPQLRDYASNGQIASWRDLMVAAVVIRSMLGISPSAYQEACEIMGPETAAVAVACILERANMINSAGGYLRDLTRRANRGEFSLGPMLMALLNSGGQISEKAG